MLAQSFKTAKQLNIPEAAVEALKKTLVLLETEKLEYISEDIFPSRRGPKTVLLKDKSWFNMGVWTTYRECGTVACIGGTAQAISGFRFDDLVEEGGRVHKCRQLYNLFYPNDGAYIYDKITAANAAQALRNYLTIGKPMWYKILGKLTK